MIKNPVAKSEYKILIIGAGPCGLGAAWRLKEQGFEDFLVLDALDRPGGLATSYVDSKGFTWDIGGHVQFSHYADFDRVMTRALPDGWLHHQREAWVWMNETFIPYPFQNNLWRLSKSLQDECLEGLEAISKQHLSKPSNFSEWLQQSFGSGLNRIFMTPYNFKVWAVPAEQMGTQWMGERVATVNLERVRANIASQKDDISWGPNSTFQFPKKGGTGAIWKSVADLIGNQKIRLNSMVRDIDFQSKIVRLQTGDEIQYDHLLSTIPLTQISKIALKRDVQLVSSNSHIVGIGLRGATPEHLKTKCWMYFPESNCPFYRATVFSNYSPNNVPDPGQNWSLMCETSESNFKPVDESKIIEQTIEGLLNTKLISSRKDIVSTWSICAKPGYPTPSLGRDETIHQTFEDLARLDIYSRGRFGAWKYEVSNQDHTFMQGFEWANWFLDKTPEKTVFDPQWANASGKRAPL